MSYYSDELVKALGGHLFLGGDGMDYGKEYTPNRFRSLTLFPDAIIVEHHNTTHQGTATVKAHTLNINKVTKELGANASVYAKLLNTITRSKNLGTLEELFIADQLGVDYSGFVNHYQQRHNRLRFVSELRWDTGFSERYISQLREARKLDKDFKQSLTSLLAQSGLVHTSKRVDSDSNPWYQSYQLVPQTYRADRKEGKLYQHFATIAGVEEGKEDTQAQGTAQFTERQEQALKYLARVAGKDDLNLVELLASKKLLSQLPKELSATLDAPQGVEGLGYLVAEYTGISEELKSFYKENGYVLEGDTTPPKRIEVKYNQGIASYQLTKVISRLIKEVPHEDRAYLKTPSLVLNYLLEHKGTGSKDYISQVKGALGPALEDFKEFDELLWGLGKVRGELSKPHRVLLQSTINEQPKLPEADAILGTAKGLRVWGLVQGGKLGGYGATITAYKDFNLAGVVDMLYGLVPRGLVKEYAGAGVETKTATIRKYFIEGKGKDKVHYSSIGELLK